MAIDKGTDGPENAIMNNTAIITAVIMMPRRLVMPTAVMTESRENTISSRMICTRTPAREALTRVEAWPSSPPIYDGSRTYSSRGNSPQEQNKVTAGDRLLPHREQRGGEPQNPAQRKQQGNAHEHGQRQANETRLSPLLQRQFVNQNGDKDDVVNAEHDFEHGERQQRDPDLRIEEPLHTAANPSREKVPESP